MTQYIDKDALVAEIERRINSWTIISEHSPEGQGKDTCTSRITELNDLLSFINTLEMKEEFKIGETKIYLNDDGGEPPYDGKQWLDLSCTEYEIPEDKFKDGDDVELIIRKKQKGGKL